MPGKKKKFVDKKSSVTFSLVHRSQRDPEAANEDAPQLVLMEAKRKEEQQNYGIEYDDDYNYLQHLRDVDELNNVEADVFRIGSRSSEVLLKASTDVKTSLILPSKVFGSSVETSVGLLNKAAPNPGPHPDCDPDILAALDGEDAEEELDDDFVIQANAGQLSKEDIEEEEDDYEDDSVGSDDLRDMDDFDEDDEEGDDLRSRFTRASMTSSVYRNANLQMIDERFERFHEKFKQNEFNEEEFFDEKPENPVADQLMNQFMGLKSDKYTFENNISDDMKKKILDDADDDDEDEEMEEVEVQVPVREWDCETILTTRTNTSHLPKTIDLPKKPKNTQKTPSVPLELDDDDDEEEEEEKPRRPKPLTHSRNRNESKDEKKVRKNAVKEDRKARRVEKAATKAFFKQDRQRMTRQMVQQAESSHGSAILP